MLSIENSIHNALESYLQVISSFYAFIQLSEESVCGFSTSNKSDFNVCFKDAELSVNNCMLYLMWYRLNDI